MILFNDCKFGKFALQAGAQLPLKADNMTKNGANEKLIWLTLSMDLND